MNQEKNGGEKLVKVQKSELGKTTFQVEVKIKGNRTKGNFTNRTVLIKRLKAVIYQEGQLL